MKLKLATGGAVAALAAALAFTAVPASARPNDDRDNHGHSERQADSGRQQAHGWAGREQHAAQPLTNAQPQARPEQRSWGQPNQGQHNWPQARQEQRSYTPQAREQQRTYQQQPQQQRAESWSQRIQRNGTYSDPNRNTAYRDSQRNQSYRDTQRNESYRDRRDGYRDDRRWDRNWRTDNRYDWQRYRQYNRNVYHVNPYYAPYRNYSYRRLNIGFYLDPLFFGQDYWIGDPGYYRLPDVYGPYRWVRYYDDALLVDVYTGEVVDVIYDFFW